MFCLTIRVGYKPAYASTYSNDLVSALDNIRRRATLVNYSPTITDYSVGDFVFVRLDSRSKEARNRLWLSVAEIVSLEAPDQASVKWMNTNYGRAKGELSKVNVRYFSRVTGELDVQKSIAAGVPVRSATIDVDNDNSEFYIDYPIAKATVQGEIMVLVKWIWYPSFQTCCWKSLSSLGRALSHAEAMLIPWLPEVRPVYANKPASSAEVLGALDRCNGYMRAETMVQGYLQGNSENNFSRKRGLGQTRLCFFAYGQPRIPMYFVIPEIEYEPEAVLLFIMHACMTPEFVRQRMCLPEDFEETNPRNAPFNIVSEFAKLQYGNPAPTGLNMIYKQTIDYMRYAREQIDVFAVGSPGRLSLQHSLTKIGCNCVHHYRATMDLVYYEFDVTAKCAGYTTPPIDISNTCTSVAHDAYGSLSMQNSVYPTVGTHVSVRSCSWMANTADCECGAHDWVVQQVKLLSHAPVFIFVFLKQPALDAVRVLSAAPCPPATLTIASEGYKYAGWLALVGQLLFVPYIKGRGKSGFRYSGWNGGRVEKLTGHAVGSDFIPKDSRHCLAFVYVHSDLCKL